MEEQTNPDLQKMCRLCLSILNGEELVGIFPQSGVGGGNVSIQMSIPMRIMACAALEVQAGDGLPKTICLECRYQLEKSYYFRKRSQLSDAKLRKHIRLLNMGKRSRVFQKTEDDDEFEEELEFEDSIKFIQKREEEKQAEEMSLLEQKLQNDYDEKMELAKSEWFENYKEELREEVANELRSSVVSKVKEELRAEMEEEIRMALREECTEQAKVELRSEVIRECREQERVSLLDDLQVFLNKKRDETMVMKVDIDDVHTAAEKSSETSDYSPKPANDQAQNVRKSSVPASSPIHEIVDEDMCTESHGEADAEGVAEEEPEFYLIEPIRREEQEAPVVSERSSKKRQHSQRYEYFEDKLGTANFRLTASESSSQEPGAGSYHIADTGEVQYYKMMSNRNEVDEQEQGIENDEENEDDGVIVFNLADDLEDEQVESMDLTELKKLYVEKSSNKSEQSVDEENKSESKALFTKNIVDDTVKSVNDLDFPVHLRKTDTPKTFKCDSCPMVFSTKNSMDRHMRTHIKVEQRGVSHQCKICFVYLSCKSALNRHMIIHTGEKPHTCDLCGKSFVQREVMKRHMLTHTGAKPHKCTQCERTFTHKYTLLNHIQRAHSEVPVGQQHACHLCPKRFNHTSGLSRHLVTHTGLTYQCVECKRKFADRSSVRRHVSNVHGGGKNANIEGVKKTEIEFYAIEDGDIIQTNEENSTEFLV